MELLLTTEKDAERVSLSHEEYRLIREVMGRVPNELELEIFGLLWSEHACYKNSLKWLQLLPRKGERVLVEAGRDNTGAIDIGDGLACVFKVESHNHPCAVQPRLAASTGLRVVHRDIMSTGATPLAILSSLRFGDGHRDTARWLFKGVVEGICDFERGLDVPVVGGEVYFNEGFNSNPVVNQMVVGVANADRLLSGVAPKPGQLIAIVGAPTGKDGIDDDTFVANMAFLLEAKNISLDDLHDVSVEKNLQGLLDALMQKEVLRGVQPIGAQGIVGAAAEMAARSHNGIVLHLQQVPVREQMTSREILLSETWGRLLLCIDPDDEAMVSALAADANLPLAVVGRVTSETILECMDGKESVARIPVLYVGLGGNAPVYDPIWAEPLFKPTSYPVDQLQEPDHYPAVVRKMITGLNVSSKKWLVDHFDKLLHRESENRKYPSDAAFVPVNGSHKALVLTMDGNPNYMTGDPYIGAQIAVAEASRNIVCAGGEPIGVTDCLNFGNSHDPEVYWQFVMSIRGLARACEAFKTPVVSGNVSFHNHRSQEGRILPIIPSPVVGMVGLINHLQHHTTLPFRQKGDMIFLIGCSHNDVNGSEYLKIIFGVDAMAPPRYVEEEELDVQRVVKEAIKADLVHSVHDVSNGGLFFTLLECAIPMDFGFDITTDAEVRKDAFLFGEAQSRVVVSVAPGKQDLFVDFMVDSGVPFSVLGHVTKGEIRVDDESYGFIKDLKAAFESTLKRWVEERD
ncbi:phosphoribosylformylglycinamidine synthase [Breznakibacter xylanolyticus]|uniref:Phosphoribosylformylglycinamidine synthase subunit PurL n=1 Tax=Breznakibacter xylanolyticus TaxID=990 RepID=A0A2W7NDD2_9BACT|nr:phosphoribosylformylglycinamidine synthase subunit PurL [Breznakibacter xylanolyticus]PZX18158.1 phosphoribosylformylglycinamidine synthase [Breznakibacter xylanolyticus]